MMIRGLRSEDIPIVTTLLRQSFSSSTWPFMTYTQHGAGAFLDIAVRYPHSVEPRYIVVAVDERSNRPVGFADFKVSDHETGFLSYICVDQAARGQGLATAMFHEFLCAHPDLRTVGLDTFRTNTTARSLYKHWGFTVHSTVAWVTRPLPPAAQPPRIHGLSVSLAAYAAYGFCELQLEPPDAGSKIGVLGETVLRCFTREDFEDDALLASARGLLGGLTTAFSVLPESEVKDLDVAHDIILLSDRMNLEVGHGWP